MKTYLFMCAGMLLGAVLAQAGDTLYGPPLKDINGKPTSLKAYEGKVLLIVNVASKCGYTPQYAGLEALQEGTKAKALACWGFRATSLANRNPERPRKSSNSARQDTR